MAGIDYDVLTASADLVQIQMKKMLMEARTGVTESSSQVSARHLSERAVNTLEEFVCKVDSSARLRIGSP